MRDRKMSEQVKKDNGITRTPTIITFAINTPRCPECGEIYFLSYGCGDYFECRGINCNFAFDGDIRDLKYNFILR